MENHLVDLDAACIRIKDHCLYGLANIGRDGVICCAGTICANACLKFFLEPIAVVCAESTAGLGILGSYGIIQCCRLCAVRVKFCICLDITVCTLLGAGGDLCLYVLNCRSSCGCHSLGRGCRCSGYNRFRCLAGNIRRNCGRNGGLCGFRSGLAGSGCGGLAGALYSKGCTNCTLYFGVLANSSCTRPVTAEFDSAYTLSVFAIVFCVYSCIVSCICNFNAVNFQRTQRNLQILKCISCKGLRFSCRVDYNTQPLNRAGTFRQFPGKRKLSITGNAYCTGRITIIGTIAFAPIGIATECTDQRCCTDCVSISRSRNKRHNRCYQRTGEYGGCRHYTSSQR